MARRKRRKCDFFGDVELVVYLRVLDSEFLRRQGEPLFNLPFNVRDAFVKHASQLHRRVVPQPSHVKIKYQWTFGRFWHFGVSVHWEMLRFGDQIRERRDYVIDHDVFFPGRETERHVSVSSDAHIFQT